MKYKDSTIYVVECGSVEDPNYVGFPTETKEQAIEVIRELDLSRCDARVRKVMVKTCIVYKLEDNKESKNVTENGCK